MANMENLNKIYDHLKHILFLQKCAAEHFKSKNGDSWRIVQDGNGMVSKYLTSVFGKRVDDFGYSAKDVFEVLHDDIERNLWTITAITGETPLDISEFEVPFSSELETKQLNGLGKENKQKFLDWYGALKSKIESLNGGSPTTYPF
jgi:hypothetical protein